MDKPPYSTVPSDRFLDPHNQASFPTPLYSRAPTPDYPDGASLAGIETPLVSPNPHALLLLCFSIGKRASISACGRSPGAMVR